jgi:hypothetical protein
MSAAVSVNTLAVQDHALDADGLYTVVSHTRRGWGFRCVCGWRSPLYDTPEAAQAGFRDHVADPPPPPSWRERRRAKRREPPIERRG